MKEKIIQGGIVNGEKMLVCPTWEDEFQKAIHKTGGCFRISMDYSAVDVSWWKELEKIAGKYGYTLDSESLEIIQEYVQKYKKYENHFWEYGKNSPREPSALYISISQSATFDGLIRIRPSDPTPKWRSLILTASADGSSIFSLKQFTYT